MRESKKTIRMSYEPDADVLRIEMSKKRIDYATELGNIIVHFTGDGIPVYVEILEATSFLKKASALLRSTAMPALAIERYRERL